MAHDDEAYFRRRAEQELELAQRAIDGAAVHAHYRLAEAYLERLEHSVEAEGEHAEPEVKDKSLFDFTRSNRVL